ncbi:hypothetical protein K523DRAFT_148902 [Schizophyllum commune Tattone D]|nr:hypothetical protein K523DRAFT_148902 [Schizophyllum commune Tattone D]
MRVVPCDKSIPTSKAAPILSEGYRREARRPSRVVRPRRRRALIKDVQWRAQILPLRACIA